MLFRSNLIPFSLKRMPEVVFQFFEFFCYVFRNFLARVGYERNSGRKFCCLFFGLSHPVWAGNNARKRFFNFLNFFLNFLPWVENERNSRLKKLFCRFLGLSYPVWAKNNAGKRFFNFLNFFAIFFRIFFHGSSMNGI